MLTIKGATVLCHSSTATMSERLQTVLVRRTTAKRRITNSASSFSRAFEANALPSDKPIMSRTVSEDIINSAEYITSAEDMLFEACRYIESHSSQTSNISTTVASNVSEPRGQKVSFRHMTHDDCGLWFAKLEDVFSSLGITSQTNKFAALTTLLTEEEAYVVRDLTLLRCERTYSTRQGCFSSNGSSSPFTSGSHVLSPLAV